jgi:2-polyprenyl-6-methoxyphenol hydroxylase-like FAD-dependent oxidoreductase
VDVLIVGAGPTGLSLACELARRGVGFRLVDKATTYFPGSRGKGLQPRSLEVLDDLGVVQRIIEHGRFHLPFRAYDGTTVIGDHDLHAGRNPTPDVPYASPLIIPQWRVEEILRARLTELGGQVELATELVALEQDDHTVSATLAAGGAAERVQAAYLVAADGGRSFVRKALDVPFEGETWKDERMLVGDVRASSLDRDHWHSWPKHPDGWVALCPLPSTDAFQLQAQIAPDESDEPSLERFQQIVDERSGRSDIRLSDPTWLSLYRANVRMVDRFRVRRVFLAGDAAHVHSPAGGQGMNTGIQDAYNLGWKLGAVLGGANESLLDTYEEERLPIAAWLIGITTKLHRQTFSNDANELKKLGRDAATLQLALHYRGSSLSLGDPPSSSPLRPGDRAPDAPLRDANGGAVRLFDLFRGPWFTLLSIGRRDSAALRRLSDRYRHVLRVHAIDVGPGSPNAGDLVDTDGHVRHAYGDDDGALFLIRPDGYVGFMGSGTAVAAVAEYLEPICAPSGTASPTVR